MIGLIFPHGIFACLVPGSGGVSAQIMLADQCLLNRGCAFRVDLLLAPRPRFLFSRCTLRRCLMRRACGSHLGGTGGRGWLLMMCGRRSLCRRLFGRGFRRSWLLGRGIGGCVLPAGKRRWRGTRQDQRADRTPSCFPDSSQNLRHQIESLRQATVPGQNTHTSRIPTKRKRPYRTLAL